MGGTLPSTNQIVTDALHTEGGLTVQGLYIGGPRALDDPLHVDVSDVDASHPALALSHFESNGPSERSIRGGMVRKTNFLDKTTHELQRRKWHPNHHEQQRIQMSYNDRADRFYARMLRGTHYGSRPTYQRQMPTQAWVVYRTRGG